MENLLEVLKKDSIKKEIEKLNPEDTVSYIIDVDLSGNKLTLTTVYQISPSKEIEETLEKSKVENFEDFTDEVDFFLRHL